MKRDELDSASPGRASGAVMPSTPESRAEKLRQILRSGLSSPPKTPAERKRTQRVQWEIG
jgi:hypothetical protein